MTKHISQEVLLRIQRIRSRLLDRRNHEGDRTAALAALDRLMEKHEIDQFDVDHALGQAAAASSPPPVQQPQSQQPYSGDRPWQEVAEVCLKNAARFSAKERAFLQDMRHWHAKPSQKQLEWLASLYKRINRPWTDV